MKDLNNSKKIFLISVFVLLLIALVAGITYAYFSAITTGDNYITGSTAVTGDSIKLEIEQVSTGTGKLVPQLDSVIDKAVTGTSGKGTCIDANGNTICKVYSLKVTNLSQATIGVTGTLQLSDDDNNQSVDLMPNLKWTRGTSATGGFPTPANTYNTKNITAFSDDSLAPAGQTGDNLTYYVVIWISETDSPQTDQNIFKAVVTFNAYTISSSGDKLEGLTSTFTG